MGWKKKTIKNQTDLYSLGVQHLASVPPFEPLLSLFVLFVGRVQNLEGVFGELALAGLLLVVLPVQGKGETNRPKSCK